MNAIANANNRESTHEDNPMKGKKLTPTFCRDHAGFVAALSADDKTRALAWAPTPEDVKKKVDEMELKPEDYVLTRIMAPIDVPDFSAFYGAQE